MQIFQYIFSLYTEEQKTAYISRLIKTLLCYFTGFPLLLIFSLPTTNDEICANQNPLRHYVGWDFDVMQYS